MVNVIENLFKFKHSTIDDIMILHFGHIAGHVF